MGQFSEFSPWKGTRVGPGGGWWPQLQGVGVTGVLPFPLQASLSDLGLLTSEKAPGAESRAVGHGAPQLRTAVALLVSHFPLLFSELSRICAHQRFP